MCTLTFPLHLPKEDKENFNTVIIVSDFVIPERVWRTISGQVRLALVAIAGVFAVTPMMGS